MIYILDPEKRVYASHANKRSSAIGDAVRKYEPWRPIIRASVMRAVWVQMIDRGFSLQERSPSDSMH